jgi:hypothetical protein
MSLINPCPGICRSRPQQCPEDCIFFTQNGGAVVNRGTGLQTTQEAEPATEVRAVVESLLVRWLRFWRKA